MQRLATTEPESDLPDAQFNVTATLSGFVFLSHNFPEPEARNAQFLDRRWRNNAPDAVDAGHDSGRAPPTVLMRKKCNDFATTDPRSDLLGAQLEVTATVMCFVSFSHSLPDPEAVDAQFPDRRRRKCTSNSGSLTGVFGSCFFPQLCRTWRNKIYNNIVTPTLTRSTEHTTSIALFCARTADVLCNVGCIDWMEKGMAR